jgi:hypothetical protein
MDPMPVTNDLAKGDRDRMAKMNHPPISLRPDALTEVNGREHDAPCADPQIL